MNKVKTVILWLIIGSFFIACGDDRANQNDTNGTHGGVLGVVESDSDGDGISDTDEINIYGTNPNSNDTDGDGLLDGEEINIYDTNVTNPDTDGDGLLDGEEVHTYETNASNPDTDNDGLNDAIEVHTYGTNPTNPDTDGDCLLDSFEILNYETNATNVDTDGDRVNDGIEIYGNSDCVDTPETLEDGSFATPKMDNIPNDGTDVIDALDPTNDSDGDGQSNIFENNCTQGDPLDGDKKCEYRIASEEATTMSGLGYAYIPGGFDVDGDGIKETGFWMSRYQARRKPEGDIISTDEVIDNVGIVNQYISKNFKVVNRNVQLLSYSESTLEPTSVLAGAELLFDEHGITGNDRISNFTPYLAQVCITSHRLVKVDGTVLDLNVTIPSHKQYMQVKKLLEADLNNKGDGRHIRNGLLGIDPTIPLFDYTIVIDEFGETKKEYVRNIVQLRDVQEGSNENLFNFKRDVPDWWEADENKFLYSVDGASSTQDLGFGIGLIKDPYAVIVRGGSILDLTLGASGANTDGDKDTTGVGFRAATPYFK